MVAHPYRAHRGSSRQRSTWFFCWPDCCVPALRSAALIGPSRIQTQPPPAMSYTELEPLRAGRQGVTPAPIGPFKRKIPRTVFCSRPSEA
jgi:hypothetical protein